MSAAILAKILEEREKERKKQQRFCIDIGTQTHGWHFTDATELLQQVNLCFIICQCRSCLLQYLRKGTQTKIHTLQARSRKLLSLPPDFTLLEQLGLGYMQDLERF